MELIKLLGVLIVIVGFALKLDSILISWPLSRQGLLEDLEWADFWKQSVQTL